MGLPAPRDPASGALAAPSRSLPRKYAEINYANAGFIYPLSGDCASPPPRGGSPRAGVMPRRPKCNTPKNDASVNFFVERSGGDGGDLSPWDIPSYGESKRGRKKLSPGPFSPVSGVRRVM